MPKYELPTKTLMLDFAKEWLIPGRIFPPEQAVIWFKQHYPLLNEQTVRIHVEIMAVNSRRRRNHSSIRMGSCHDLFFKVAPGRFRLWDPNTDPAPFYPFEADDLPDRAGMDIADAATVETGEVEAGGDPPASAVEFAFERDLKNYLTLNLDRLEPGLSMYRVEDLTGIEYPVGGRYIDILAVGADGALVVIELKVSRGYDKVIGQLLRYMAYITKNLAEGRPVRGIIVASSISEDLRLATSMINGVRLVEYRIDFSLTQVEV